jgi:hypothetical protein
MAIYSSKKTSQFPKGINDKAERGISSPARSKLSAKSAQQFSGVAARTDRNFKTLSNRAKRALIHQYKGPRKRPIE